MKGSLFINYYPQLLWQDPQGIQYTEIIHRSFETTEVLESERPVGAIMAWEDEPPHPPPAPPPPVPRQLMGKGVGGIDFRKSPGNVEAKTPWKSKST